MGLFSTLKTSSSSEAGLVASSSSVIPTVVQLYADDPIQLDTTTSRVTAYTPMTYQAVQVGSTNEELKNKHQNPDLGIWNCAVKRSAADDGKSSALLVDHVLDKIVANNNSSSSAQNTYILTVNLCGGEDALAKVEPTMSLFQAALIRHFIENPPAAADSGEEGAAAGGEEKSADPADAEAGDDGGAKSTTATTSLFDFKSTQFGLAPEDDKTLVSQETESDRDVKFCLMICAILPTINADEEEVSYRTKQAQDLVIYHLRKYAFALNATLCFVNDGNAASATNAATKTADNTTNGTTIDTTESTSATQQQQQQQPTLSFDELGHVWKQLALNQSPTLVSTTSVTASSSSINAADDDDDEAAAAAATTVTTTAIYGPNKHQEEFIETILLRNANCPGHWEATKDSLWVALPSSSSSGATTTANATDNKTDGDQGWLTQLRDSIPKSAIDKNAANNKQTDDNTNADTNAEENADKPKDAAVSSFFESLLKNP